MRVFRQKPVAGVNAIHLVLHCQADDALEIQVGPDRLARLADPIGFVRLETVQGEPVFVGIDGDRAYTQLVCGAENADGNFAAIGNEKLADRLVCSCLRCRRHIGPFSWNACGGFGPTNVPSFAVPCFFPALDGFLDLLS